MGSTSVDLKEFRAFRKLVGFVVSRPPCVMFVIFIGMFALAFLSLGYYTQHKALLDDEKSQEWNKLYTSLLSLKFCFGNSSSLANTSFLSAQEQKKLVNISLPYYLLLPRSNDQNRQNISLMSSTLPYFYMHLKDDHAHHKIHMRINTNTQSSTEECPHPKASSKDCSVKFESCVTLSLPRKAMPSSSPPKGCIANFSTWFPHRDFMAIKPGLSDVKRSTDLCRGATEFSLSRYHDYHSEVFLSWEDRSKVNLRLQIASYILFVILLSFILYAMLKGKPLKPGLKKIFST